VGDSNFELQVSLSILVVCFIVSFFLQSRAPVPFDPEKLPPKRKDPSHKHELTLAHAAYKELGFPVMAAILQARPVGVITARLQL
jgi:hypothetical protein